MSSDPYPLLQENRGSSIQPKRRYYVLCAVFQTCIKNDTNSDFDMD